MKSTTEMANPSARWPHAAGDAATGVKPPPMHPTRAPSQARVSAPAEAARSGAYRAWQGPVRIVFG